MKMISRLSMHVQYLKYVIKHKWFVYKAGRVLGGISLWRLLIHDYTKFSRSEWTPYAYRFFSGRAGLEDKTQDTEEFSIAWNHHWHHNPHHWEHWIKPDGKCIEMPNHFLREMVADWLGAGRGITGSWDLTAWFKSNHHRQNLHPDTNQTILYMMDYVVPVVIKHLESTEAR